MRTLLLFLTFVILSSANAQETINFTDSLGQKQGHWMFYGKDLPESGVPDDVKVKEGNYVNDRKEGTWINYHSDGKTPKLKGEYKNNRPTGIYTKSDSSGNLKETGYFDKNMYHDSLKRFYDNGQLEYEAWYNEDGKEEGKVNYYYPNGQLKYSFFAMNGVLSEKEHYDINGNKLPDNSVTKCNWSNPSDIKYCTTIEPAAVSTNAQSPNQQSANTTKLAPEISNSPNTRGKPFNPDNYNKCYNSDNEPDMDGTFKDGRLWNGKVYVYDQDGILLKVEVYKNGMYHSDGHL